MDVDAILERACARHAPGGPTDGDLRFVFDVTSLGGLIPRGKGLGRTHPKPSHVTVEPAVGRTTMHDYPAPERTLVYERGTILDAPILYDVYRRRFRGPRKLRRWTPRDACYFFGYALVEYLGLPWSLRGRAPMRVRSYRQHGRTYDALTYRWPQGADTHSEVQTFHFAADGLLVRHDYRADILGAVFTGAHGSSDYTTVDGIAVAQQRRVVARLGRWATPLPVLEARFAFRTITPRIAGRLRPDAVGEVG